MTELRELHPRVFFFGLEPNDFVIGILPNLTYGAEDRRTRLRLPFADVIRTPL